MTAALWLLALIGGTVVIALLIGEAILRKIERDRAWMRRTFRAVRATELARASMLSREEIRTMEGYDRGNA